MLKGRSTGALALAAALMVTIGAARAADDAKYPNWKGEWNAINPCCMTKSPCSTTP
jgi:hypothetical protein